MRVLPLHVANKIAAGEVVERPSSVAKELIENAIDAGATRIAVSIVQGGRKLVAVQDNGCGMTKDDALLSLERQATSKIRDVTDIEEIDTLGFRGEAIPSIASVSRFTLTTRRTDSDEGIQLQVNAGTLADVHAVGCPPGTLVEVRDLFCNVPARRKFLRAYATEEKHVKQVFTVHALAHPAIAFSLAVDGRELYKLAPAGNVSDRVRDLLGAEFLEHALAISLPVPPATRSPSAVRVSGFIERPNLSTPTRHDQYVFVNGRPASAPSIAYAIREAYPRQAGDTRPAAVLFIEVAPNQVDVNVHPTKREVRFRDNVAVKIAIMSAIERALGQPLASARKTPCATAVGVDTHSAQPVPSAAATPPAPTVKTPPPAKPDSAAAPIELSCTTPAPVAVEFAIEPDSPRSRPWQWFKFLAQSASGYLLVETDSGIVTINPQAARERIVYERLLDTARASGEAGASQALLIPETIRLAPVEAARISSAIDIIRAMGFQIEAFGRDTFKIDAIPQIVNALSLSAVLATIARDLSEGGSRRAGAKWREELIAKSIAKSFAGASMALTRDGATKLVEELCACRMPYVCPRGKPVMIFTSTRELDRKFARN